MKLTKLFGFLLMVSMGLGWMGCTQPKPILTERTPVSRAHFEATRLPNTPSPSSSTAPTSPAQTSKPAAVTPAKPVETAMAEPTNSMGLHTAPTISEVRGTYTFVIPPNVTQVHKQTKSYEQYMLYWGQPAPTDVPFITITVGPNMIPESQRPTSILKPTNSRRYILNGLMAQEWTGYTTERFPFCEIIAMHDDKGDQLQAIAIAKTKDVRKAALEILASISWQEN